VARVHGRFGLKAAVKLVHGDADPRLERQGLTALKTFGTLRSHPEGWLLKLMRRCVTAGWVGFSGKDRPVVLLTEEGRAVMKGERPPRLLLPPRAEPRGPSRSAAPRAAAPPSARPPGAIERQPRAVEAVGDAATEALFEALRRERLQLAQEQRVPPFVVASDRTLRDIALMRPRTMEELRLAYGIGPSKAERYGARWLEVVRRA
jgi:ATP-dependent DNA helicase RecQ